MKIKSKLITGASLLTVVPVITVSLAMLWVASDRSGKALQDQARNRLVSLREATKNTVENYFTMIRSQVQTLSNSQLSIDAVNAMIPAYNIYQGDVGAMGAAGKKKMAQMRSELTAYYSGVFTTEYNKDNPVAKTGIGTWVNKFPDATVALQHTFIAANPNPLGKKQDLLKPDNSSFYGIMHARYHPSFLEYQQRFGFSDILLVDSNTGNIIYSVVKAIDFGTSLKDGPFADSGLGKVFREANKAENKDLVAISDFAPFAPAYDNPAGFIASPIFKKDKKIGVLVLQINPEKLSGVMTNQNRWQEIGLDKTAQSYLVGADKKMRSNNRRLIENPQAFQEEAKQFGMSAKTLAIVTAKKTTIGLQQINTSPATKALAGESGFEQYVDPRGTTVLSAYAPLNVAGLPWGILAEIDRDEALQAQSHLRATLINIMLGSTLTVLIIGALLGWLFAKMMVKPIEETVLAVKDIAEGEGDLTRRLDDKGNDELAELATWFNRFMQKLQELIQQFNGVAGELTTSATELLAVSDETNTGIARQKEEMEHAATAINQLTTTIADVAKNAELAASGAMQARSEAGDGKNTAEESVITIQGLSSTVERATEVIGRLEQDSIDIGGVLDVIRTIAEQTNLLALNAAIEAARAGEHGRGFAVVADEVRTLAFRTQQSTQEIQEMIERLQKASKEAVTAMDESNEQAKKGRNFADETGNVLIKLTESINQISDMNTQIASAAQEQSVVAEEINNNVVGVTEISNRTAAGAQQTASASDNLSNLAVKLKGIAGQFKV